MKQVMRQVLRKAPLRAAQVSLRVVDVLEGGRAGLNLDPANFEGGKG